MLVPIRPKTYAQALAGLKHAPTHIQELCSALDSLASAYVPAIREKDPATADQMVADLKKMRRAISGAVHLLHTAESDLRTDGDLWRDTKEQL